MLLETKHDQSMVKKHHLLLLFKIIKRNGPISRADLAKITKMSATSASRIVKDLIDENFIEEVGETEGNIGRRARLLAVKPKGGIMFGVNIETDFIEIGVVDLNGTIIFKKKKDINLISPPYEVLDDIADFITGIMDEYKNSNNRVMGCGVSIPGIVDWPTGKVVMSPQFHWSNIEVGKYLEKKISVSVLVDNQVKAILLGESLYGNAVGVESATCIYVGSGLGAAFIDKGEVVRGADNMAGEIGHTIVNPNGPLCHCGRMGCLQTYICASALEKESGRPYYEIFEAKTRNEPWAVGLLDKAAEYLAMTISNVTYTYNPEVIILAGTLIDEYPEWVQLVKKKAQKYMGTTDKLSVQIHYEASSTAGILGASCLVLSDFLDSPIAFPIS